LSIPEIIALFLPNFKLRYARDHFLLRKE
jgi:hypothetical protein